MQDDVTPIVPLRAMGALLHARPVGVSEPCWPLRGLRGDAQTLIRGLPLQSGGGQEIVVKVNFVLGEVASLALIFRPDELERRVYCRVTDNLDINQPSISSRIENL